MVKQDFKDDEPCRYFAGEINAQMDLIGRKDDQLVDRLKIKEHSAEMCDDFDDLKFSSSDFNTNGDILVFKSHVITRFRQYVYANYKSINNVFVAFHDADFYNKDSKEVDDDGNPKYHKGQLKTIHMHVVLMFKRNTPKRLKAIKKAFYDEFNIIDSPSKKAPNHFDKIKSLGGAVTYLTHTFDSAKNPYNLDDMVCWHCRHNNNKDSKNKVEIFEDIGNAKRRVRTATSDGSNESKYWLSSMYKGNYASLAGGSGQDEAKAGIYQRDTVDDYDDYGFVSTIFGWTYNGNDIRYAKGEALITRQSGHANDALLDLRAGFNGKQNIDRVEGAKESGSDIYQHKLSLTPESRKDTSEIEQLTADIEHGVVHANDANQILKDDWGAKGATAYIRHQNEFKEAATLFYSERLKGKYADNKLGVDLNLTVGFITGAGGSGKDAVAKRLSDPLNKYRNLNLPKDIRPHTPDTVTIHGGGVGKTPDLYSHWRFEEYVVMSDVDGKNFDHHEFTGVFDPHSRSAESSSRNTDKSFLPDHVVFTNKNNLHWFCFHIVMNAPDGNNGEPSSAKLKYGLPTKAKNNHTVYRDFNTSAATYDVVYQLTRRIPFYVRYLDDPSNIKNQIVQVFIMVPKWHEYVQVDEFVMKRADYLSPSSIDKESRRVADRIAKIEYNYDWTGEFGHQQTIPYDSIIKYDNCYDVVKDETRPLSILELSRNELDSFVNRNDDITDVRRLHAADYAAFKTYLKTRLQSIHHRLSAKGGHSHNLALIDFALSKLADVSTPIDDQNLENRTVKGAIATIKKIKQGIDAASVAAGHDVIVQPRFAENNADRGAYVGYPDQLLELFEFSSDSSEFKLVNAAYRLSDIFFSTVPKSRHDDYLADDFSTPFGDDYSIHYHTFSNHRQLQLVRWALEFSQHSDSISSDACSAALGKLDDYLVEFHDQIERFLNGQSDNLPDVTSDLLTHQNAQSTPV